MFCGKCGTRVVDGNKFCENCGEPVHLAASPAESQGPAVSQPPAPPPAPPPPPAQFVAPPPPPPPAPYPAATAPPAYSQFGGAGAYPPAVPPYAGGPQAPQYAIIPPDLHWVLVFLLGMVTFGIFSWIWMFRESAFVKRINPASKATVFLVLILAISVVVMACYGAISYVAVRNSIAQSTAETSDVSDADIPASSTADVALIGVASMVAGIGGLASFILYLVAVFSMRRSIINYYNSVEPLGLRLGGIMTFFFSYLYFQYHFSRIAAWKKTSLLTDAYYPPRA